ncbi:MAG: T9SS type A sorting domain-containing protein [Schleiferiaceae bacterium]
MKKRYALLALAVTSLPAWTNANGPSGGKSGSPASNNQTCSSCHSGASISTQTVNITTDIPSTGFVPNTNYLITVTNATGGASNPKSGFQASVENAGHQGSLTAGTGNKVVNSNYVTHTSSGNSVSNGQAAWTFTWNSGNAPDGTTIYVASMFANGNGATSGDAVTTQTLALTRSTLGTDEPQLAVRAFPNPASASFTLELPQGLSVVRVFTLSGAEVFRAAGVDGMKVSTAEWPHGTYVLDVRHADGRTFRQQIQVAH